MRIRAAEELKECPALEPELARLLTELRVTSIEIERDARIDRAAAEKLLEWYAPEMDANANGQAGDR